jgi:hypothetical protein
MNTPDVTPNSPHPEEVADATAEATVSKDGGGPFAAFRRQHASWFETRAVPSAFTHVFGAMRALRTMRL